MKYETVNNMRQDFSIQDFNQLMNEAKQVLEISTKLSFFDIRILNNLLLVHEIQYYCRITDNTEIHRYSLDLILEIVQNRLHKNAILMNKRIDESMCESNYYYIFSLN